jgi:hypothetical protein
VFGRAPRSSRFKKSTPLQKMSAKHNQLQQLHRGSAQKNGGAGPNSMVFMEYLRRYLTKSKFCGVGVNYPPLPLVTKKRFVLIISLLPDAAYAPSPRPELPCCSGRRALPVWPVAPCRSGGGGSAPACRRGGRKPACVRSPPRLASPATAVTTPPEIIPYYRLNHSIWSLSDNKEASC